MAADGPISHSPLFAYHPTMSVSEPTTPEPKPISKSEPTTGAGVKDTIESILIAFILAFVFRAFVVEAFVIPTGSMAPTLMGAHTRFHCPDCGYDFDVNFSAPRNSADPEAEDQSIPPTAGQLTNPIYCPNCGFEMPADQVSNPPVAYGDRILVLKYLYLLSHPQRWGRGRFQSPDRSADQLHQTADRHTGRSHHGSRRRHLCPRAGRKGFCRSDQTQAGPGCAVAAGVRQRLSPAAGAGPRVRFGNGSSHGK